MSVLVTNNATGSLLVGISDIDTVLLVRAGQGSRFPSPVPDQDWFYITVQNEEGALELMKCTKRDGDSMTVVRGVGKTTAMVFKADSIVELRPCAELFNDKVDVDKYEAMVASLQAAIETLDITLTQKINALSAATNVSIEDLAKTAEKTYFPYAGGRVTGEVIVEGGVRTTNVAAETFSSGTTLDQE